MLSILLFIASVSLLCAGLFVLKRIKVLKLFSKLLISFICFLTAFFISVFAYDFSLLQVVGQEKTIATLSFEEISPQQFSVVFTDLNGNSRTYRLHGDEWLASVRLVRIRPLFNVPLFPPSYQWDRLEGRYRTIGEELSGSRSVYSLKRYNGVWDTLDWLEQGLLNEVLLLKYGVATYLPMEDQSKYQILLTRKGIYGERIK